MNNTTTKVLRKISLLIYCFIFFGMVSFGQQTANWYFGSPTIAGMGLRVDFSTGSPVVTRGYPLVTEEGSSSISDASGNPLFYTDGTRVWDASTNTTFGTGLLGGTSSTQSGIIMPKPGATNQWLLFTSGQTAGASGTNGIHYYTVTGSPGAFSISGATNLAGTNVVGEGLFIIGSTKAGSSFWVIARDNGNTGIVRAWDVSNTGVVNATPVTSTLSNTGWTQTNYSSNIGTIKSNTCQNQLAFTYLNGDVDLTDFNTATGQVVANTARRINIASAGGNSGSYGIEFSSNDAYLYITNLAGNSLSRYNIATSTTTSNFGTTSWEAGQLQLAPDGKIYMAIVGDGHLGNGYLGVISNPGAPGATFNASGLLITNNANPDGFSYRGLPTFPKSLVVATPELLPGDGTYCTGVGIPLSYTFAGSAASQVWSISPGTGWSYTTGTSTSVSPTVTFSAAGNYTVSVDITDVCGRHYIQSMVFNITTPLIPAGSISCASGQITLNATGAVPADYPKYTWYDAASGGNVLGVGSPVTLNYGDNVNAPASVWVEIAASTSTPTSGTNQSIGMASGGLSWAANGSPYGGVPFTVISDVLTLKSFMVRAWTGAGANFDVVIRNASSTIVFQQTFTMPTAGAGGSPFTVNVNTSFVKGNYTITLNNTSIQWYGGSWGGGTNAGQITLPTFGGAGTYSLANLIYDYRNFAVTSTCSQRVKVDRLCTLPVSIVSLDAQPANGTVLLSWTTSSEINNDYFEIQRSSDGINFVTIGQVDGNGNTQTLIDYEFVDLNPIGGVSYYRLVQYDYDGKKAFTAAIKVYTSTGSNMFVVSPNPSPGTFKVNFADLSGGEFTVYDVLGKIIQTRMLEAGTENIELGADLISGAYVFRLSCVTGVSSQLVIKE